MKKIIIAIVSLSIVVCLVLFSAVHFNKTWTYVEDSKISSPDGDIYYWYGCDFYLDGIQPDKKVGKLLFSDEWTDIYSVIGDDGMNYVVEFFKDTYEKYHPTGLDGGASCDIYVKEDCEFYDCLDTDISGISYIPPTDRGDIDYRKYVLENGISGDKAITVAEKIFTDVYYSEEETEYYRIFRQIGRLLYYPKDVKWFCFSQVIIYNPDYGYYVRIDGKEFKYFKIPEDIVKELGIEKYVKDNGIDQYEYDEMIPPE